jgi:hypothetical protein
MEMEMGTSYPLSVLAIATVAGCGRPVLPGVDAAMEHGDDIRPLLDGGPEVPPTGCSGTIAFSGTTPEGAFSATGIATDVSSNLSTCERGVRFFIVDRSTGSEFILGLLPAAGSDAIALGTRSVNLWFGGKPVQGTPPFEATTTATVEVTAADPPPFAACEQALGNPIKLNTGNIALTMALSQDGFALMGGLSTPYCACRPCSDTH